MKQTYKLIVSDLDNTLLTSQGRLTSYTIHSLLAYQKQGYTVMLATGRFLHETTYIIEALQLEKYHGYVACCNGSMVMDIAKQTTHTFDMIEIDEATRIMQLAKQYHLTLYIQMDNQYHLQVQPHLHPFLSVTRTTAKLLKPIIHNHMKSYLNRLVETNVTSDCASLLHQKLYKICFLGSIKHLKAFQEMIHKQYSNMYNFFDVTKFSMEIVRRNVSKANAVQYVCDQMQISMDQVLAFGDSGNDESLLEKAGMGITMKNGYQPTVSKAKHVSRYTNDKDGVARALKDILNECDNRT